MLKDSKTSAYGASVLPETTLRDAIDRPRDTDHPLLYPIHRLTSDVAACVKRRAGGVTYRGPRR